jgi:cyd operon protein YbgT
MWYFAWILGLGFALTFGILNALWNEFFEDSQLCEDVDCETVEAQNAERTIG